MGIVSCRFLPGMQFLLLRSGLWPMRIGVHRLLGVLLKTKAAMQKLLRPPKQKSKGAKMPLKPTRRELEQRRAAQAWRGETLDWMVDETERRKEALR